MKTRPEYTVPANTPADLAALLLNAAKRKAVYVNPKGEAVWLNPPCAQAIAKPHGGTVFAPVA